MAEEQGARGRARPLIIAAVFLALIAAVGYMSISSSSYKTISDLAHLDRKAKVTVEGSIVPLGQGSLLLMVDGVEYRVSAMGSYGVARGPDGSVYAVFILGDDSNAVLALYKVGEEELSAFQAGSGLKSNVVVSGVFDPGSTAVLHTPNGAVSLKVLYVDAILKGCHESYQRGAAKVD